MRQTFAQADKRFRGLCWRAKDGPVSEGELGSDWSASLSEAGVALARWRKEHPWEVSVALVGTDNTLPGGFHRDGAIWTTRWARLSAAMSMDSCWRGRSTRHSMLRVFGS